MNDEIFILEVPVIKHGKPKIITAENKNAKRLYQER